METTLSKLGGSGACHENRKGAALYGKKTEKMLRSRLFKNAIIALYKDAEDKDDVLQSVAEAFDELPFLAERTRDVFRIAGKNEMARFFRGEDGKGIFFPPEALVPIGNGVEVLMKPDYVKLEYGMVTAVKLKDTKTRITGPKKVKDLVLWALAHYARMFGQAAFPEKKYGYYGAYQYLRKDDDLNDGSLVQHHLGERDLVSVRLDAKFEDAIMPVLADYAAGKTVAECTENECRFCEKRFACHYQHSPAPLPPTTVPGKELSDINLTDDQQAVIDADDRILRVIAKAGSGKTMTLVMRVIVQLLNGASPEDFLLIAFTVDSAKEMMERMTKWWEALGDGRDISNMKILTVNGLGQWLLEQPAIYTAESYTDVPRVMTAQDKKRLINETLDKNPVPTLDRRNAFMDMPQAKGDLPIAEMTFNVIKEMQASFGDGEAVRAKLGTNSKFLTAKQAEELIERYDIYEAEMQSRNMVDYIDQNVRVLHFLRNNPYYMEDIGIKYLIVDEAQDLNEQQIEFIRFIIKAKGFVNALFVGDPDQAIYSFRGCNPEILIKLEDYLGEPVKTLSIANNFRCSGHVIEVGNQIIMMNKDRIPGGMCATREDGAEVDVQAFRTFDKEVEYIVEKVKTALETLDPWDIHILAANRTMLGKLRDALTEAGIPCILKNPELYKDNSRCQAAIALAEAVLDKGDTAGIYTYANALLEVRDGKNIRDLSEPEQEAEMASVRTQIRKVRRAYTEGQKKKLLSDMLKAIDENDEVYEAFLDSMLYKDSGKMLKELSEFYDFGAAEGERRTLKYPAVGLSTVHSDKGLEHKFVILSLTNFDSASLHKDGSEAALEEKRRLVYVGVTRARDFLTITGVNVAYGNMREGYYPNTFLREAFFAVGKDITPDDVI